VTAELTVGVVDSDRLYRPEEGARIAASPACRELTTIHSPHGHDGFLLEADQVAAVLRRALGTSGRPAAASGERRAGAVGAAPSPPEPSPGPSPRRAVGGLAPARRSGATGLW